MTTITPEVRAGLEQILVQGTTNEDVAIGVLKAQPNIDDAEDQQVDALRNLFWQQYNPNNIPKKQTDQMYRQALLASVISQYEGSTPSAVPAATTPASPATSGLGGVAVSPTSPTASTGVSAASSTGLVEGVKADPREVAALTLAKQFYDFVNQQMSASGKTEIHDAEFKAYWEQFASQHSDDKALDDAHNTVFNSFGVLNAGRIAGISGTALAAVGLAIEIVLSFSNSIPSDSKVLNGLFAPFGIDLGALNKDLQGTVNLDKFLSGLLGQLFFNPVGETLVNSIQDDTARMLTKDAFALSLLVGMIPGMQVKSEALTIPWGERYQESFRDMVQALVDQLYVNPDLGLRPWQQAYTPELVAGKPGLNALSFVLRGAMAIEIIADGAISAQQHVYGEMDQHIIGAPKTAAGLDDSFRVTSFVIATNHSAKGEASCINDALALTDLLIQTAEDVGGLKKWDSGKTSKIAPAVAFGITMLGVALPITASLAANPAKMDGLDSIEEFIDKWKLEEHPATLEGVGSKAAWEAGGGFLIGGLEALGAAYGTHRQETVQAFMQVNRMFGRDTFAAMTGANAAGDITNAYASDDPETLGGGSSSSDMNDYQFGSITKIMNSLGLVDIPISVYAGISAGSTAGLSDKPWAPEYWPAYLGLGLNIVKLAQAYELKKTVVNNSGKESAIREGANTAVNMEWLNLGLYTVSTGISYAITQATGHAFDMKVKLDNGRYSVETKLALNGPGLQLQGTFGGSSRPEPTAQDRLASNEQFMGDTREKVEHLRTKLATMSPGDENYDFLQEELAGAQQALITTQMEQIALNEEALRDEVGQLNAALSGGMIPYNQDIMVWGVQRAEVSAYRQAHPDATAEELGDLMRQVATMDQNALTMRYRELTGRDVRFGGMNVIVRDYRDNLDRQQQQLAGLAQVIRDSGLVTG